MDETNVPILGADAPREVPIIDVKVLSDAKKAIKERQDIIQQLGEVGIALARTLVAAARIAELDEQSGQEVQRTLHRVVASTGVKQDQVADVNLDRAVIVLKPKPKPGLVLVN